MKHFRLLAAGLFLLPALASAQDNTKENEFSMSAQIRPRAEYRNGALFPREEGASSASFINNRARLSLEYKRTGLSMKISAQHVGVWGQDPQIDKNGRFIMNEAWAKLESKNGFFAQLGRQTLSYDDERILGGLDWNVAGRYHDALKLGYQNAQNQLHFILAFNQNDEKNVGTFYNAVGQPYKSMQTLWYHYKAQQTPFEASLLFMNLGWETGTVEKAKTRYLQTMGTYLTFHPGNWSLNGAFYYQTGKGKPNAEMLSQSVSAFMWSLTASYQIDPAWSVTVGSDYLSGNNGEGDKNKAFDPLYGTHHKFYGAMDYFYASSWVSGIQAPGLWDNRIGVSFKASPTVALQANYHYFSAAQKPLSQYVTVEHLQDTDSNVKKLSKGLGSEIDTQVDWAIMKDVKLSAGYSFMLGTRTMDAVKGGNHKSWQDWGWVSLNINPKLFFAKW